MFVLFVLSCLVRVVLLCILHTVDSNQLRAKTGRETDKRRVDMISSIISIEKKKRKEKNMLNQRAKLPLKIPNKMNRPRFNKIRLEPQLRPQKHNQNRQQPESKDPRIEHHPPPPPFPLRHTAQGAHAALSSAHGARGAVEAVDGAGEDGFLGLERGVEGVGGRFELAGEGEERGGEVFLGGAVCGELRFCLGGCG